MSPLYKFEHVPGFFHQDVLAPKVSAEASLDKSFGLLDESPDRWAKFKQQIADLNTDAPEGTSYKVLWFARHGQGFHNVAEVKYSPEGTWDVPGGWGRKYGDGELTWGPDPYLTHVGEGQARALSKAWVNEAKHGVPLPTKWYTSPLRRTSRTCILSWEGIWGSEHFEGKDKDLRALEQIREVCGMNTCDKRQPKSEAQAEFPHITFPESMPEEDLMFDPDVHESEQSVWDRIFNAMEEIWKEDDTYVSLTAHCGLMRAAFVVLNHPNCPIVTGELVPIVVRKVNV